MHTRSIFALAISLFVVSNCHAQLRIADYNTGGGPRAGMSTILQGIGDEARQGFSKPIDVLLLQEQTSSANTTQAIVDVLNGIYGAGIYARSTLDVGTSGGGRPGMIYNTQTVQLIESTAVGIISGSGAARQAGRYELRPVGYESSADFYVYSNHYKASDTAADATRRNNEAIGVRANADALGQGTSIIYAGDFNIYKSSEAMWGTLTATGNGQAFDPIDRVGSWSKNSSFMDVHTQSPVNTARYGGQITGGMDDRFDFQLVTSELMDDEGMSIIPGSYHAFGNNGTHAWNGGNGELDVPSNTALPMPILNAIASNSDHLPVVADYQLPARMAASLGSVPSRVLVGASASAQLSVRNSAPVVTAIGADELDYAGVATGSLSAAIDGIAQPLAPSNLHTVTLATSVAGNHAGQVQVTSTSQSAANATFSQNVNYEVVDHAIPSLSANVTDTTLDIDFGILALGSDSESRLVSIYNREATAGFTAALDLDAQSLSGDTGSFSTTATLFSGLAAGAASLFQVSFNTSMLGDLAASLALTTSDENLPGTQLVTQLNIALHGIVTWAGDANLDWIVDFSDFQILQNNFGSTGAAWQDGDFNGDGIVGFADFQLLQNNFGQTTGSPLTAVPEPGGIALVLSAMFAFAVAGRNHLRRASLIQSR